MMLPIIFPYYLNVRTVTIVSIPEKFGRKKMVITCPKQINNESRNSVILTAKVQMICNYAR